MKRSYCPGQENKKKQRVMATTEGLTADEWKVQGNELYKKGDYRGAIEMYDKAIEEAPTEPSYYGNRAAALFMLLKYDQVVQDCNRAIVMDPMFMKAYLRKSKAHLAMVRNLE